jgi:hypothetical protein
MKLLNVFGRMFQGGAVADDVAHTIDHAPLEGDTDGRKAKLKNARRRHGKPFHTHQPVARETEPSMLLKAIAEKAGTAQRPAAPAAREATVSQLPARRKNA